MSRLLVDDVTKTDARALLNVNKMATISDIVAPSNEYIYASGANELTVVEGCVIAVGGAGIFKTANTILTAANLDAGSAFAVGKDYAKTGETTGKGVFTIVEVKAGQGASVGWGRLKSGAGWISLDYATRLA